MNAIVKRRRQRALAMVGGLIGCCLLATAAGADVRFGRGVRIGGHDFSHQTYNRHRRAIITLYDHPIRHAGCVWRADRFGGRTKICRLRRIAR